MRYNISPPDLFSFINLIIKPAWSILYLPKCYPHWSHFQHYLLYSKGLLGFTVLGETVCNSKRKLYLMWICDAQASPEQLIWKFGLLHLYSFPLPVWISLSRFSARHAHARSCVTITVQQQKEGDHKTLLQYQPLLVKFQPPFMFVCWHVWPWLGHVCGVFSLCVCVYNSVPVCSWGSV